MWKYFLEGNKKLQTIVQDESYGRVPPLIQCDDLNCIFSWVKEMA